MLSRRSASDARRSGDPARLPAPGTPVTVGTSGVPTGPMRWAPLLVLLLAGSCVAGPGGGADAAPAGKPVPAGVSSTVPGGMTGLEPALGATVRVLVETCEGGRMGSGFVVDGHTVLTNRHVVEGAQEIRVETRDGTPLEVESADESDYVDLGIIHIAPTSVVPLSLAGGNAARGTAVRVLGYPLNGPLTTTGGLVAEYVVDDSISAVDPVIRLNVDLNPGNSGGPVIDPGGRVVGIAYASERSTGYGLAVAAATVEAARRDLNGLRPVEACS